MDTPVSSKIGGLRVVEGGPALSTPPVVSIILLSYQNLRYLPNAIDGIFEQESPFPMELIVGDDASTDGSALYLEDRLRSSPFPYKLILRSVNVGMHKNYDHLLRLARGTYVANIDGDDAWVYTRKCLEQVELLESDPQCVLVYGRAIVFDKEGKQIPSQRYGRESKATSFEKLFEICDIPHSGIMFRRNLMPGLRDWMMRLPNYDWSLMLCLGESGGLQGLPIVLTRYNWHGEGSASSRSAYQHACSMYAHFAEHFRQFEHRINAEIGSAVLRRFEKILSAVNRPESTGSEVVRVVWMYLRLALLFRVSPRFRLVMARLRHSVSH